MSQPFGARSKGRSSGPTWLQSVCLEQLEQVIARSGRAEGTPAVRKRSASAEVIRAGPDGNAAALVQRRQGLCRRSEISTTESRPAEQRELSKCGQAWRRSSRRRRSRFRRAHMHRPLAESSPRRDARLLTCSARRLSHLAASSSLLTHGFGRISSTDAHSQRCTTVTS